MYVSVWTQKSNRMLHFSDNSPNEKRKHGWMKEKKKNDDTNVIFLFKNMCLYVCMHMWIMIFTRIFLSFDMDKKKERKNEKTKWRFRFDTNKKWSWKSFHLHWIKSVFPVYTFLYNLGKWIIFPAIHIDVFSEIIVGSDWFERNTNEFHCNYRRSTAVFLNCI